MKKLFLILFLTFAASLFAVSTSFASTKSQKDGVNQAGGCKTKDYPYKYVDSHNKTVHGDLKVGVCVNEHYSTALRNWVGQTDVYMTETGAYASCDVGLGLDGIDSTDPYDLSYYNYDMIHTDDVPGIHCPNRTNFHTSNKGLTFVRAYTPHSGINFTYNNVGVRFYGYAGVYVNRPDGENLISDTNDGTFVGPSLTMK